MAGAGRKQTGGFEVSKGEQRAFALDELCPPGSAPEAGSLACGAPFITMPVFGNDEGDGLACIAGARFGDKPTNPRGQSDRRFGQIGVRCDKRTGMTFPMPRWCPSPAALLLQPRKLRRRRCHRQ